MPNVKEHATHQRGRASITGLRLNVDKGMKTGRLMGVAVSRLVRLLGFALGASRQSPGIGSQSVVLPDRLIPIKTIALPLSPGT